MEPPDDAALVGDESPQAAPAAAEVTEPASPPFVVGVGASAGGLEALERLFRSMPADSGLSFVVIQHLSPDFRSLMDELLARHTPMAIHRVEDGMPVEANSIYLIPPKKEMIISGGRLLLTDKDSERDLSLPIDHFFRSLAHEVGRCAVAVVLSGTGSDGSRGIRDVHEAGGLVIAQDDATAKFDGMPKSARDTGLVDLVLAPEEMPGAILKHVRHSRQSNSCSYLPSLENTPLGGYEAIFKLLRDEYGIDFSYYKPNTVARRIQRRLSMNQSADLEAYVAQLQADPAELNSLYRDLLIGVTRFFRDREAFELLEQRVLPELLAAIRPEQEVRAWVAGCATGEEAYSLAILLHERLQAMGRPINLKVFASDVHRASLEFASAGVYGAEALAEVTPQRLNRYFVKRGEGFQIVNELRQLMVFARHNVIKDAPFTKLDLVSCRNLLIYLQPPAQKKALALFHFGLRTGGVLLLGPSESPGELAVEFEAVDEHWRIFRKRRDVRLPPDLRLPLSVAPALVRPPAPAAHGFDSQLLATYDRLLDEYLPPGLLVTDARELVHTFRDGGRFLRHRPGRPTGDVLDLLEGDLKMALAGAVQRAAKEQAPVSYRGVRVRTERGDETLDVSVRPILNRHGSLTHLFIGLESAGAGAATARTAAEMDVDEASRQHLNALETELRYTRENLQATIEELETSNEELQASNEELVASNEELQSTNEELHSVNEELYTVNAEYQKKIVELTELTDDMDNLLRSTDIGTIFLDRDLCIRKFTPQIGRVFDLLPQDVGRRIDSFSYSIQHPGLLDDVRRVLDASEPVEKEVQDRAGNWFFLRILPYRSHTKLEGVVLSLIDVSTLKRIETELRTMSSIVASSDDAIIGMELDGVICTWNRGAASLFGYVADEAIGRHAALLATDAAGRTSAEMIREALDRAHAGQLADYRVDAVGRRQDGSTMDVQLSFSPIHSAGGTLSGISLIARDVTAQKRAERDLATRAEQLEAANRQLQAEVERRQQAEADARSQLEKRDQFLAMLSHELRNPLAAVLNSAALLEWENIDQDTMDAARGIITRQSQHMARLLDDLLDVSRITRGKIEIRRQTVDLVDASRDAIEAVRARIDSHHLTLGVSLPPRPVCVCGDRTRLQQIQVNLLTNAVKYTPPGGRIWLSVAAEGQWAVLRVRDTGIGIPPAMRERIFDLFVQVDDTPGKIDGGMGVGLTLVQTLVRLHGGDIRVDSGGAGQGSEFTVRLPLVQPAAATPKPAAAPQVGGLRVVLVEDHADIRVVTGRLLRAVGCEVTHAENGQSGIEAIAQQQPDLALIDIGLPDIEGYEVARRVRALPIGERVKLLALTGFGQPEDRQKALEAGFDDHLVKPLEYDALVSVIRSAAQDDCNASVHDGGVSA